jgi:F-type H+-transporting ATPase subunit alpha
MAELTLSATDIASALKKNLEGFEPSLEARTVGRATEVGDGIAAPAASPTAASTSSSSKTAASAWR